ncbi:MAG: murein L,D-transpeptidase catalytic domain family protein [Pedobacter sp.]|uniref:murein L,D-transpeptidase catalytic domain family protein n=1 Tax=Pedobacter sp. TaxID=1411316 RepID=UPI0028095A7C|nr:murein L,D-transpeptidase catalytic domain family protein [Pedobacter sp.]MDQ8003585.1 murein L,D-transpeptidase catalytic domain family protein [Pedobacter sp.]
MRKNLFGLGVLGILLVFLLVSARKPSTSLEIERATSAAPLSADSIYNLYINNLYTDLHLKEAGLSLPVFEKALTGFYNLKQAGQTSSSKQILSIADFDQLSTQKRLYIIDLNKKQLLLNTWVAHGQNSGADEATNFSNINNSFSSSLGFYVTGEIYRGIHGKSLKLDGMDEGFNSNARSRSIVVHGAPYVSNGTIKALGRLGRSQGCPAVAPELADKVIHTIEDKTVLFINKSQNDYHSKYLNETLAANFANDIQTTHMD